MRALSFQSCVKASGDTLQEGAADVVRPNIPGVLVVFDAGTESGEDVLDGDAVAATVTTGIPVILPDDFRFGYHVLLHHVGHSTGYKPVTGMIHVGKIERHLDLGTERFHA